MTLGSWKWDWYDWSLSKRHPENQNWWMGRFALKCSACRHWSLGCQEPDCQLFCGLCAPCKAYLEDDENWRD